MSRPKGSKNKEVSRRLCMECHKEPMWGVFRFCAICLQEHLKTAGPDSFEKTIGHLELLFKAADLK
jgi:hypothetical protein